MERGAKGKKRNRKSEIWGPRASELALDVIAIFLCSMKNPVRPLSRLLPLLRLE